MEKVNFVIKPSTTKISIFNALKVLLVGALIIGLAFYMTKLIGDMSVITEEFGITAEDMPETGQLIISFILGVFLVSGLTFAITFVSNGKVQYIFYHNRIEIFNDYMIFNTKQREIMYNNIISVRSTQSNQDRILQTGSIIFELTGTDEKEEIIQNIDKAKEYLPYIQQLLDQWKAQSNMEYQENAEMERTLDRI